MCAQWNSTGSATLPSKLVGVEKLATEWVANASSKSTTGSVMISVQASANELLKQEQKRKVHSSVHTPHTLYTRTMYTHIPCTVYI